MHKVQYLWKNSSPYVETEKIQDFEFELSVYYDVEECNKIKFPVISQWKFTANI